MLKSFLVSVQAQVTAEGEQQIILEHGSIYALSSNISFHHCKEPILRLLQGRNINGNVRIRNVGVCMRRPTLSGNAFSGTVAQIRPLLFVGVLMTLFVRPELLLML